MEWAFLVALVLAIPVILFPVAWVWYLNAGGLYDSIGKALKRRAEQQQKQKEIPIAVGKGGEMTSISVNVKLARIGAKIVASLAVYGVAVWLFLAGLGWPVALAFGLAIPFILALLALLWYLSASGLLRVMTYAHQRQTRKALKHA